MFCSVIKKLSKLIYGVPYKPVTHVPGTFVTLDSGPHTPQGGGNLFLLSICFPSPLAGEGTVRGYIPNFSHLPSLKGEGLALWSESN